MKESYIIDQVLSLMLKKINVPSEFHEQAKAVEFLLKDDVSGMVGSLLDFAISSASVDYTIETSNANFNAVLKKWADIVNIEYNGQVPIGLNEVAKEYFKERWKGSGFVALKVGKWATIDGIMLPTKLYVASGKDIYADETSKDNKLTLSGYNYNLGLYEPESLSNNVILQKIGCRWFDKYPTPFVIKRGIYHNCKIIESIKNKQVDLLEKVIPYLFLIKKGTEALALSNKKVYSDTELSDITKDFQALIQELKSINVGDKAVKSPVRSTMFDEELKHLIPDMSAMFNPQLFQTAEKNILAGLGIVDIADLSSFSRKESVLNPKAFATEVNQGVNDFRQLLKQLVYMVREQNPNKTKYGNANFSVYSSPVKAFLTIELKNLIRQMYDRGKVSAQTAVELIGEVEFETEVRRRENEATRGIEKIMYPQVTVNTEDKGIDITNQPKKEDKNGKIIPEDKTDPTQKKEYDMGSADKEFGMELEGAPYAEIKDLPPAVKKLAIKKRRQWMATFNSVYNYYMKKTGDKKEAESHAFPIAWHVVNDGTKKSEVDNSNEEHNERLDDLIKLEKMKVLEKQGKLLDKLNKDKEEENA